MTVYYRSPLGWLKIQKEGTRVVSAVFVSTVPSGAARLKKSDALFSQLEGYFAGRRKRFSVPCDLRGTAFQKRVWRELAKVPYGRTVSYAQLAERIGKKSAVRAVANAVGQNPVTVVIPCHRVIGSDGSLTGYAFGLKKKSWLLKTESR